MKFAWVILLIGIGLAISLAATAARAGVTLTPLVSFTGTNGAALGSAPEAALMQGIDGSFYGTTLEGGTNGFGDGTVFKVSTSGTFTTLVSFNGTNGANPQAGLVQGSDGNFYGATTSGGTNGAGTIFRLTPSNVFTSLLSFSGADGDTPNGLIQGADGFLYGTTYYGGANGGGIYGTVFKISTNGILTTLASFDGTNGANPQAGLVQGSDGSFYGTTANGGTNGGWGTVFSITTNGLLTPLVSFNGTSGANPLSALALGPGGMLYGTTSAGGVDFSDSPYSGNGTVFEVTTNGELTTLHFFAGYPDDGAVPQFNGLAQGIDGNFYGTTWAGGANGGGTVFRISPGGSNELLYSFGSFPNDGFDPSAGLVQGSDGNFYGVTKDGGTHSDGIVFALDLNGGGGDCTYALSATSAKFSAKGGSKNVTVKIKGTHCAWTAVSNDSLIRITSGGSGAGSDKVEYTVLGNPNPIPVTGTMTIAGQTFTVNEEAGGCTFKLSPKAGKFKAAGGSGTVRVTANLDDCGWYANSNDSFITLTGGISGTSKGVVRYTIAPNTNTTAVTGTLTIAGRTFTITQAGVK